MIRLSVALLAAASLLVGCGGSATGGTATVWVTRDRGAHVLVERRVPAGLTAMQGLSRAAKLGSSYGGGFVRSIDGLASTGSSDWFYYVNGYEADRGAAEYRLRPGDVEWWDYFAWQGSGEVRLVVGAFPEPLLHGYDGRRRPAAVRYAEGLRSEATALARVVHAGSVLPVSRAAPAGANLLVVKRNGRNLSAAFRGAERAGDPVLFTVSASFARRLVRDPSLARLHSTVP
ncbi:MAG: DUF4430 domain-containing protein [Gaiellaceae bacterium]